MERGGGLQTGRGRLPWETRSWEDAPGTHWESLFPGQDDGGVFLASPEILQAQKFVFILISVVSAEAESLFEQGIYE